MGLAVFIVDAEGRRMRDEDIQRPAIIYTVQQQMGYHSKCTQVGFSLCILVGAIWPVLNGAAQTTDQEFVEAGQFHIQIDTSLHEGQLILRKIIGIMVSRHIQQRDIQNSQQVLKVGIRQVAAPQDQLYIAKMAVIAQAVESLNNLIAHCKDFHSEVLCRRNRFPARELLTVSGA